MIKWQIKIKYDMIIKEFITPERKIPKHWESDKRVFLLQINSLRYVTSTMLKGGCDFGPRAVLILNYMFTSFPSNSIFEVVSLKEVVIGYKL